MIDSKPSQPSAYVPGVCNINHAEIAKRRKLGYIGGLVFVVLLVIFVGLDFNRFVRLLLFFPAFLAASGFLQAKNKFCTGYGGSGLQNAEEGSATASKVSDAAAAQKDKRRALRINLQAAVIGLVLTGASLVVF